MTNLEKIALNTLAERLEELASLENANFDMNNEKDAYIKDKINPYMEWFNCVAMDIKKVVELSEETGHYKKFNLEEIIRMNI